MADEDTAAGNIDESDKQVTFNVKSSSDAKFVLTVPVTTTVGDLKQKLSTEEYASIPAERQRLIYSGRVLKDADTVGATSRSRMGTLYIWCAVRRAINDRTLRTKVAPPSLPVLASQRPTCRPTLPQDKARATLWHS